MMPFHLMLQKQSFLGACPFLLGCHRSYMSHWSTGELLVKACIGPGLADTLSKRLLLRG